MNTIVSNAFHTLKAIAQSFQVKSALALLLATFLLVSSVACSANTSDTASRLDSANSSSPTSTNPYDKDTGSKRELYKPTQRREGGMNNYNDDPQYDSDAVKADAKEMVKRAEKNLQKRAQSPQDIVENVRDRNQLGEKVRDFSENVTSSTEKLKNDFSEGTQRGMSNLKANADKASENAPRVVDQAKQNAQAATKDAREGIKDIPSGLQKVGSRAADAAKDGAQNATDSIRDRA
jgi:hypothetical protein